MEDPSAFCLYQERDPHIRGTKCLDGQKFILIGIPLLQINSIISLGPPTRKDTLGKDIFDIDKNKLSYGRGYVYSLQYHLVWCTKYRKKVLKNGIDTECKEMLQNLAEEYKFQILAMEVMPDHIHLLVDCKPQFYISDMIKIMKGNLARQMFLAYPELKKELWGGHLWNPSYCAITVSDRSRDQVLAYIEGQKEKEKKKA